MARKRAGRSKNERASYETESSSEMDAVKETVPEAEAEALDAASAGYAEIEASLLHLGKKNAVYLQQGVIE